MLASYRASEYWDLLAAPPCGVTVNVVRAARSDRRVPCLAQSSCASRRGCPRLGHVAESDVMLTQVVPLNAGAVARC